MNTILNKNVLTTTKSETKKIHGEKFIFDGMETINDIRYFPSALVTLSQIWIAHKDTDFR